MSKKKRKSTDNSCENTTTSWNYNVFQDDEVQDYDIPDGDTCKCGGCLWRIDDYIICGHCGKRWYPGAVVNDED